MVRIVVIETDRALAQAIALDCAGRGVAVRLAETVGEGVRHMAEEPVSAVLVAAGLVRLPAPEQARLFQAVAPGVAMVLLAEPGTGSDERLRFEVEGFQVVDRPIDVREMLAKIEVPALVRARARRAAAVRRV